MHVLAILLLALGISMDSFAVSLSNSITLHRVAPARLLWIPAVFGITQATLAALGFVLGSFVGEVLEAYEGPITFVVLGVLGAEMVYSGVKAQRKSAAKAQAANKFAHTKEHEASGTEKVQNKATKRNEDQAAIKNAAPLSSPLPEEPRDVTIMEKSTAGEEQRASHALTIGATVLIEALATSLDAFAIGFMLRASNTNPALACMIIAITTFVVSAAGIIIGKKAGMILGEKAQMFGGIVLIGIGVLSLVT